MKKDQRDAALKEMRFRVAAAIDQPRLIRLINAAFAVETFFEGPRIDNVRLTAMMAKGRILMAEDREGCLLASVYIERRGSAATWACWRSIPRGRAKASAAVWSRRQKSAFASRDVRPWTLPY